MSVLVFTSPNVCFCTTWGNQTKNVKMNGKPSIHSICPNLWIPTAGLLLDLTVLQQCVYLKKFRNVCKVKKWLVELVLVWNRTLSILLWS